MRKLFTFSILFVLFYMQGLLNAQAVADPQALNVYHSPTPIVVDGALNEAAWSAPVPYLKYKLNSTPSGLYENTPTNDGIVVKGWYRDTSTTLVRFIKYGNKLYISLQSNDKQVCRFGDSWEGDGLFMKIKNNAAQDIEYKLYFNAAGVNPNIVYEGPTHGMGAAVKGPGTTVNDSSNIDGGYTAELMISLDSLGFASNVTSVQVMLVIFEPDDYSDGVGAWGVNGSFAKQWWGSEWGPTMRTLNFVPDVVPVELSAFAVNTVNGAFELSWSTLTEVNNSGFEIERSLDNELFTKVGFVEGRGTTTEKQIYSFVDNKVQTGVTYYYRLKQVDLDGKFTYSEVQSGYLAPAEFSLNQNYPNPFNPSTKIGFSIPEKANVKMSVFNMLGEEVAVLLNSDLEAGVHSFDFNAAGLQSGIYVYSVQATGNSGKTYQQFKKMTLIK